MKYDHKQRMNMAYHGVDADELENPKQKLPPVESRMSKLKRLIDNNHPRKEGYVKQLKVYQTLLHPEQAKMRGIWNSLWGA